MSAVIARNDNRPRNILGELVTTPDYSSHLSPDLAIRKFRTPLTVEERYFNDFLTAMPKESSHD